MSWTELAYVHGYPVARIRLTVRPWQLGYNCQPGSHVMVFMPHVRHLGPESRPQLGCSKIAQTSGTIPGTHMQFGSSGPLGTY